jgi:hypothetical protein
LLAAPRLRTNKCRSAFTDLVRWQKFATRKNRDFGDRHRCSLIGDRKLCESIYLVTPKVNTNRNVGRTRVNINDRTADCDFATVLDLHLASVAETHQVFDEFNRIGNIADTNRYRFDFANVGAEPLHKRPNRRHDHCWRSFGFMKSPQHP